MFTIIDRLLILSYVKSYFICLVSLLSLYIVVDLFNNIDDFARIEGDLVLTLQHIGAYYSVRTAFIFDLLSEAIALLAAMFTIAWLQRNNELLPLLSAGVSARRVLRPVLLSACMLSVVNVANQEFVIPTIGGLFTSKDDPNGEKPILANGAFASNDIHISARMAIRRDNKVIDANIVIPPKVASGSGFHFFATEAIYVPEGNGRHSGGWLLNKTTPVELPPSVPRTVLVPIDTGKYFLYSDDVDFERLTRNRKWYKELSTLQIYQQLDSLNSSRLSNMAVFFHMRLTRPILSIILVVMGIAVIMRDQNRNIYISAGFCIVICAIFYVACVASKYLGDHEILTPAQAAWLPVFIFGPVAFVLLDAVHT
ncbi:MAG: LptF/LptG family permease [Gemmataceae bacterium]